MQASLKKLSDTNVQLTLTGTPEAMAAAKTRALKLVAKDMRLPGFRQGKAPLALVEKNVSDATLQTEFLDIIVNELYGAALDEHHLRPIAQPKIKVTKFVPYETIEVEAEVEVIGEIKLPDYMKMRLAKKPVTVDTEEIDEVIANLRTRAAEKKDVDRAAKLGDQVWIDFAGKDAKTEEAIAGADGQNYALVLGSGTFIPGFEDNLVGLKANDEKTFPLTFPKDYGAKELQNRKVTFTVTISKVQEVVEPKLDDAFAATVGPFKTLAELKADIKGQMQTEKEAEAERTYADDLITQIADKSTVAIPESLIEAQIARLEQDQKQNLAYRGQTFEAYLKAEGLDEAGYRKTLRPAAELRVKVGLVMAQIAEDQKLVVTKEALAIQSELLKEKYPDAKMRAEIDKPEVQQDLASRMLSDMTITLLTKSASASDAKPAKKPAAKAA